MISQQTQQVLHHHHHHSHRRMQDDYYCRCCQKKKNGKRHIITFIGTILMHGYAIRIDSTIGTSTSFVQSFTVSTITTTKSTSISRSRTRTNDHLCFSDGTIKITTLSVLSKTTLSSSSNEFLQQQNYPSSFGKYGNQQKHTNPCYTTRYTSCHSNNVRDETKIRNVPGRQQNSFAYSTILSSTRYYYTDIDQTPPEDSQNNKNNSNNNTNKRNFLQRQGMKNNNAIRPNSTNINGPFSSATTTTNTKFVISTDINQQQEQQEDVDEISQQEKEQQFVVNGDKTSTATTRPTISSSSSSQQQHVHEHRRSRQQLNEPDTIEHFANDIATVLKVLRKEERDPTIPRYFRITRMPSFTYTWSFDDWKRHTSRLRYVRYLITFPTSSLLRRIMPSLIVLFIWSCIATWACASEANTMLKRAVLSLTPLSLVSTFVAALLTLRSNQGLSRLNEGRLALGQVVLYTRDMAQMISAHVYPKDKQLGLKLVRHISVFSWLLKLFLRGKIANNGYDEDILYTMLDPIDAQYVLSQRKKPVAVVTRLRQVFSYMLANGQLTTSEASRLDHTVQQLNYCIMVTERIQASPIPPLFTAHTGRLLIFYLFFLPLSLRGSDMLDSFGTIITTMVVGFAMLGLDEISHLVEEPFRLMPLWHLAKNSMIDCGDALVCQPPSLFHTTGTISTGTTSIDDNPITTKTTTTTTNESLVQPQSTNTSPPTIVSNDRSIETTNGELSSGPITKNNVQRKHTMATSTARASKFVTPPYW